MSLLGRVLSVPSPVLAESQSAATNSDRHGAVRTGRYQTKGFGAGSSKRLQSAVRPSASTMGRAMSGSGRRSLITIKAIEGPTESSFLSLEEAGLIEMTNLDMHERFLARLTVSSLNLLRRISEQDGTTIEELNAGKICDWFVKDKAKREENIEDATLKWDS